MKRFGTIMLSLGALALQACATYYYEGRGYESSDAEYYTDEHYYGEETYDEGYPIVDLSIVNASYYPWWSMDYYYLGNHYYRPYYFGYSSGWYSSFAHLYAYPPYYAPYGFFGPRQFPGPYYAYYDPWYGWPRYGAGYNYVWYDSYWTRRYREYAAEQYPEHRKEEFGNARYTRHNLRDDLYPDARDRAPTGLQSRTVNQPRTTYRNVSVAPDSASRDNAMGVRSRSERKIRESHIGPAPVTTLSRDGVSSRKISVSPRRAPTAPSVSNPRIIRQAVAPQARPPAVSPRSAPPVSARPSSPRPPARSPSVRPPTSRGSEQGGHSKLQESGSRRRN